MQIHKAGTRIIIFFTILFALIIALTIVFSPFLYLKIAISIACLLLLAFTLRFFRVPKRTLTYEDGKILSPADGHIVAIEHVNEDEFLKKETIQVSVFMSVWNVHINWFPAKGIMKKYAYHPGKFLVARHPKSSTLNERTSILMETQSGLPIVVRQIAGIVARRIENYVQKPDTGVEAGQEMGFIKFGSRVDVFLPTDANIKVKIGENVKGIETVLATV